MLAAGDLREEVRSGRLGVGLGLFGWAKQDTGKQADQHAGDSNRRAR